MDISYLDITDTHDLSRFYSEEFSSVPYAYPVTASEFEDGIRYPEERDEPFEDLSDQKMIVGMINGNIVGFSHVALWSQQSEEAIHRISRTGIDRLDTLIGVIRFFHYKRGQRKIGQAILDESERYLQQRGASGIRVFSYYSYRFYRYGQGMVSDQMDHVLALFGINEYATSSHKQLMCLSDFKIDRPSSSDPNIAIRNISTASRGSLPNIDFEVYRKDQKIGEAFTRAGGHYNQSPMAQDTFYLSWITIDRQYRGKGLGRYFLNSVLWKMSDVGYRHSTLYTGGDKFLPHLLYSNIGYRIVETNYMMFKKL